MCVLIDAPGAAIIRTFGSSTLCAARVSHLAEELVAAIVGRLERRYIGEYELEGE
jgi:hypothetical protein